MWGISQSEIDVDANVNMILWYVLLYCTIYAFSYFLDLYKMLLKIELRTN